MTKEELIEKIIEREWDMFDKVQNEGGRADCQDDFRTFYVMRKSQFLTWDEAVLTSYLKDLERAKENGRNLLTEKYAFMMRSTAPEDFEKIKGYLPEIGRDRFQRQEKLIMLQVIWTEMIGARYPLTAGRERPVHTSEDTPYQTSFETYLRGEMSTWSDETFELYERCIYEAAAAGRNTAMETLENTAKLYGYESAQALEERLRKLNEEK